MPRERRAFIGSSIWTEQTIRDLTRLQQHAYFLADTQPDVNRCGVVPYRLRRWSGLATDADTDALHCDFLALHATRHVVLDVDNEELLIRTYIRHDGVLTQPQVVGAAVRDYPEIISPTIRLAFLTELHRLWHLPLEDNERLGLQLMLGARPAKLGVKRPDQVAAAIGRGLSEPLLDAVEKGQIEPFDKGLWQGPKEGAPEGLFNPPAKGQSNPQSKGQSKGQSNPPPEGQGQALARYPVPYPDPSPFPDTNPTSPTARENAGAQTVIANWIDRQRQRPPDRVIGQCAKTVGELLDQNFTPDVVAQALDEMTARSLNPATLPSLVHGIVNGRAGNGGRTALATGTKRALAAHEIGDRLREAGQ